MIEERNQREVYQGRAVSNKTDGTIAVVVETERNRPIYGKRMKHSKKYKTHDENDTAKIRDAVKTMETCPSSITKHFRLLKVVEEVVII